MVPFGDGEISIEAKAATVPRNARGRGRCVRLGEEVVDARDATKVPRPRDAFKVQTLALIHI